MTRRALRPCSGSPICPNLVPGGGLCPDHQDATDRLRGSPDDRGYNRTWRTTRRQYVAALRRRTPDGLARCKNCGTREDIATLHIDHIDGRGPNGPAGHDPRNLQALCAACHGRKTRHQTGTTGTPQ